MEMKQQCRHVSSPQDGGKKKQVKCECRKYFRYLDTVKISLFCLEKYQHELGADF
jgi:hypothetical protein